jgi:hypothetical protein
MFCVNGKNQGGWGGILAGSKTSHPFLFFVIFCKPTMTLRKKTITGIIWNTSELSQWFRSVFKPVVGHHIRQFDTDAALWVRCRLAAAHRSQDPGEQMAQPQRRPAS